MRRNQHAQASAQGIHSPGFNLIAHHLRTGKRQWALDLGTAITRNIEFLSSLHCKVYVEHLALMLGEINAPREGTNPGASRAAKRILSDAGQCQFDVLLAWDLLNYLTPDGLDTLVARLHEFSKRGTLLFAIMYNGKQMPGTPSRFTVLTEDCLQYASNDGEPRPHSPYSMPTLQRKMTGFVTERTYLLQNNTQEYVFRFE
ncbi:MAG: hypothetical protein H0V62_06690 [Gammaproteobacteria bacterium]|nr:hypothetical protein [Gammaproteobacteria bacterium]